MRKHFLLFMLPLILVSCQTNKEAAQEIFRPEKSEFDTIIDGKEVSLYALKNDNGVEVYITNYGATIVSVLVPDKNGNLGDVTLGYNSIKGYIKDNTFMGTIVGRFANRIAKGKFSLDGKEYSLAINNDPNALHGGPGGYYKKVWDAEQEGNSLKLSLVSPDGEEGYPGTLTVNMTYSLNNDDELIMEYEATTDAPTIVNLTNHAYWTLSGEGDSTINNHILTLNADYYTPVDSTLIPTGEIAPVEGTPFDFTEGKVIGQDINADDQQLAYGMGYDHNWVLNKEEDELALAASLYDPKSGRVMDIFTTEPAIQFYGGNFMDGSIIGKSGKPYKFRSTLALETQHYPDAPNHDNFPSTVLRPGEKYSTKTVHKYYTKSE